MLRTGGVRVLGPRDAGEVADLLDTDPVAHVFVASRVDACGLDPWRLGAELWGYAPDGELQALCYAGANLVPLRADERAALAFAERARRQGRRCSSLVGEAAAVGTMWAALESPWGPAREVRASQPLLSIATDPLVQGDPGVRAVRPEELETLLPAAVAMFTEEVGVSPLAGDGGALYRARVRELIGQRRAFARIDDGEVLFKAEVGAASSRACQVQGVWVHPRLRGQGYGTAGTATVVELARRTVAPVVSLYVNDYNAAARAAYDRVGFTRVGTFASILF